MITLLYEQVPDADNYNEQHNADGNYGHTADLAGFFFCHDTYSSRGVSTIVYPLDLNYLKESLNCEVIRLNR